MNYKKELVKKIKDMSKYYSGHQVFRDWVELYAMSIANSCEFHGSKMWEKREKQYLSVIGKYKKEEQDGMVELSGLFVLAMENDMSDVLGSAYMELETGNKNTGQFFTPDSISRLAADLLARNFCVDLHNLHEPASGSGGMLIAYARALRDKGVNYQRELEIYASDIDFTCVYMCYIQLSILGIKATVARQDTLRAEKVPPEHIFVTPAKKRLLL